MALLRQGATRSNALLGSGRDAWRLQHDRASCHSRRAFASSSPAATSTTQERAALAASSPLVPKPSYFTHEQHKTPHSRTAGTYAHAWSMLLGASVFGCSALLAANAMPSAARTEAPPNGDKSAVSTQPAITSVPVRLEKLVPTLSSDPSVRRRRSAGRDRLLISTAAVRGDRSRMEDTSFVSDCKRFNAVFDGHGGAAVSTYIQKHLFPLIAPGLAQLDQEASSPEGKENDHVYKKLHDLIQRAVEKIDADVLARPEWKFQGTTATGVMLYDEAIVSFNVGDSRAVLSRGGQTVELTRDHKPNDPIEMARIQKLGGTVKWYGYVDAQGDPIEPYGAYRVNGNLAVGRAIGDRDSRPYVTGEVEIKHFDRDFDKDEFIVIASDGLWDVFTSEEAVTFVHDVLSGELGGRESWRSGGHSDTSVPIFEWSQQYKSDRGMIKAARARRKVQIANYLVQEALFRGTSDNVSVIVVWLK